jgi:large repetitive protein
VETVAGSLSVTARSNNQTLVPDANIAQGGSGADRTVTITPAANQNGAATITVQVSNGSLTASDTFMLTVSAVNDVSAFTKGANQSIAEDAGAQGLGGWASADAAGLANETGQSVSFLVTNDNNPLFAVQPAIASDGTLTYTPAANANGSATVTVRVQDDGGTANGGVNTSAPQTFTITVNAVNDAPSFTIGANQSAMSSIGTQAIADWATDFMPGPADEANQSLLAYEVISNSNPALFAAAPVIAVNGTLSYTSKVGASGAAAISVVARDSGGTANGGVDISAVRCVWCVGGDTLPSDARGPRAAGPQAGYSRR